LSRFWGSIANTVSVTYGTFISVVTLKHQQTSVNFVININNNLNVNPSTFLNDRLLNTTLWMSRCLRNLLHLQLSVNAFWKAYLLVSLNSSHSSRQLR